MIGPVDEDTLARFEGGLYDGFHCVIGYAPDFLLVLPCRGHRLRAGASACTAPFLVADPTSELVLNAPTGSALYGLEHLLFGQPMQALYRLDHLDLGPQRLDTTSRPRAAGGPTQ